MKWDIVEKNYINALWKEAQRLIAQLMKNME